MLGGKTDQVSFDISYPAIGDLGEVEIQNVCTNVKIPACGWLEITGAEGSYQCVTHETCE